MGKPLYFLLLCFGNNLFAFGLIGKKAVVKVAGRAMNHTSVRSLYHLIKGGCINLGQQKPHQPYAIFRLQKKINCYNKHDIQLSC